MFNSPFFLGIHFCIYVFVNNVDCKKNVHTSNGLIYLNHNPFLNKSTTNLEIRYWNILLIFPLKNVIQHLVKFLAFS